MYKSALPLVVAFGLAGCPADPAAPVAPTSTAVALTPTPASQPAVAVAPVEPVAAVASGDEMKIADVFAQKDTLGGKTFTLRGKVVKFNANIMGSNWIHVQDGSGGPGTNDITVTTKAVVAVGDTVQIDGALSRAKDFGAGYKFDVIVENARVTKQ